MSTIDSANNGNVGNVGSDKRFDTRSITDSVETLLTTEKRKYSVTTGLVNLTTTGKSAVAIITNTGEDNLVVTSNALMLFNITGTGVVTVGVESSSSEGTGVFTALTPFNWNIGSTREGNFTAKKGEDAATFTGASMTIDQPLEIPATTVANVDKFVMEQGSKIAITLTIPASVTSVDVLWAANVYEDNSLSVRQLT